MAAIGPAIVIACVLDLNNYGYAKKKGLTSSMLLAVSMDNIIAITIASILVKLMIPAKTTSTMLIMVGIPHS